MGNPPGKPSDPLGDELTWEQFLTYCKERGIGRIWIVTTDSDFVTKFKTTLLLNAYLHRDLVKTCGENVEVRCFDDLADAVKDFGTHSGLKTEALPTDAELNDLKKELQELPPLPEVQDAAWMIAAKIYPEYRRGFRAPFAASIPVPILAEMARSANAPPSPDEANTGQDT
jgi:hypothetical protein